MPTPRSKVRRIADRGHYDRETIYAILDEGVTCHVGFVADGQLFVIPTGYARGCDRLILHGSIASRTMKYLKEGFEAYVSVTLVDGVVLARSQFHSSMNYRSVVALGRAVPITEEDEKRKALHALVEHLVPGRAAGTARPTSSRRPRSSSSPWTRLRRRYGWARRETTTRISRSATGRGWSPWLSRPALPCRRPIFAKGSSHRTTSAGIVASDRGPRPCEPSCGEAERREAAAVGRKAL